MEFTMTKASASGQFRGADQVVRALQALDVAHVFVIASVHNLPIVDALQRSQIQAVMCRHEQGAVHAADAYARVTGKLGVAIVSTGPGTANAMGGLFEANYYGSPVMLITGQVPVAFYGSTSGYVHEAERQIPMLESVTRAAFSVRRAADIADTVLRAASAALRAPFRPTAVEIPIDLQYAETQEVDCRIINFRPAAPDRTVVARFAELLKSSLRPLLWIGSGIYDSQEIGVLASFVDRLRAPVITNYDAKGAVPDNHPLVLGCRAAAPGVRELIADADLVIGVGNRFPMYETDYWTVPINGALVHIHSDAEVIGRSYYPALAINADPAATLAAAMAFDDWRSASDAWQQRAIGLKAKALSATRAAAGQDHAAICDSVRRHLPASGVVVRDLTIPTYVWGDRLLPIDVARRSLRPAASAIGPGLPFAIGAALGTGEVTVVLHGDGGVMLSLGELATAVQYRLPIIVCVFCDNGYGILRFVQDVTFGGMHGCVDMPTPDFAGFASAVGMRSASVDNAAAFDREFAIAVAKKEPTLIAVDMTKLQPPKLNHPPGWHLGDR
jgi:acetolactate synthase-1/2/3 large subunit